MNIDQANAAKKSLLARYGDWIEHCVIVLGDKGFRLEVSVKRGGRSYIPAEIGGVPIRIMA